MKTLQIGNVTLENNLVLGPMAGVTDLPFRLLCKEQGAGLLCMEMVSILPVIFCESVLAMLLLSDCVNSLLILRKRISVLLAEITST